MAILLPSASPAGCRAADDVVYTVAPSDLTFLLHECRHCFWNKVVLRQPRPQGPMPGVFTRMDRLQRDFFDLKTSADVSPSLPAGRILCKGLAVMSEPLRLPGTTARVRIRGALDALLRFDSGDYGIVDFKTSSPSESNEVNYRLQLHAYALALEHAEWPLTPLSPVTHLGLLCFDPSKLVRTPAGGLAYEMNVTWMPMTRDMESFMKFLTHVVTILERPLAPLCSPNCRFCAWTQSRGSK
jgi:hypothetical protein